jgi:hypothetical protein
VFNNRNDCVRKKLHACNTITTQTCEPFMLKPNVGCWKQTDRPKVYATDANTTRIYYVTVTNAKNNLLKSQRESKLLTSLLLTRKGICWNHKGSRNYLGARKTKLHANEHVQTALREQTLLRVHTPLI